MGWAALPLMRRCANGICEAGRATTGRDSDHRRTPTVRGRRAPGRRSLSGELALRKGADLQSLVG